MGSGWRKKSLHSEFPPGSENFIMDRPAGDEGNLPVYNIPDEEEVGEVRNAVEDEEDEEQKEDTEDYCNDSGSLSSEEEDEEQKEDTEDYCNDSDDGYADIACLSPLSQQFPPVNVWEALRQNFIPSFPPGHPCSFLLGVAPLEVSSPRLERPEEAPPSAPPRSGVFTPTTAGLVFSTKRIREDDSSDSAPSTLGLCCPMVPLLVTQCPPVSFWQTFRPFGVAPPDDSAPQVERPEAAPSSAPPSTSGLGFSTKRTWEEACRAEDYTYTLNSRPKPSSENSVIERPAGDEEAPPSAPPRSGAFSSTTPGLVSSTKRIREDDSSDSALSTSGPGFSTKRIREDDSRDSALSTLCLCCPMVPLSVQQRPPVSFWQTFRPFGVAPPDDSAPQVERPEAAPSSAPPTTSGLSTKRTWEEACWEEDFRDSPTTTSGVGLSTKRNRQEDFRDSPTPTSGLGLSTKRNRQEDFRDSPTTTSGLGLSTKRNRQEDFRDSPTTTSGLGLSTKRNRQEDFRDSPTPTSGLGLSTKRNRQEDFRDSPTTTSGLGLSTKRNRQEDFRDSPTTTSGLGLSTKRNRQEDFRDSPTTTSGLGLSTKRNRQEESPTPTSGVGLSTKRIREEDFRDLTPSSSGPWPPMDKRYRQDSCLCFWLLGVGHQPMTPERPSSTAARSQLSARPCEYSKDLHALHPSPRQPLLHPPAERKRSSPARPAQMKLLHLLLLLPCWWDREAPQSSTSVLRKQEGNMTLNDILNK
ncbi:hypothetical protein KUCAC02_021660 [Chaenocephalus aceratus]|uniref:Uncharacterized protein n=1 Tax=Chaenocephalus aceratus TaxID=36190 RepID=A0ACB9XHC3_CHAAC|nr:hypothetical protein KUCAC02_021660 [Chaenocephalus aceratus]